MTREWKPGDLALVKCSDGVERIAWHFESAWGVCETAVWRFSDGMMRAVEDSEARPLVVIDPEDAEQVERLAKLLWPHYADREHARLRKSEITADALREFATPTPPKPDEPTGLGAVVEDAEGSRWYRTANANVGTDDTAEGGAPCAVWKRDNTNRLQEKVAFSWCEIHAVRVLSGGVS